jgi:hypothetical protein
MNNNNIIERKGWSPCTRKVYKRAEYPRDYYNLKNKSNLPDSFHKLLLLFIKIKKIKKCYVITKQTNILCGVYKNL